MNRRQFLKRLGIIAAGAILLPTEQQLRRFWQLDQTMVRRRGGVLTHEDLLWLQEQQRQQGGRIPDHGAEHEIEYITTLNWMNPLDVLAINEMGDGWVSNDGGNLWHKAVTVTVTDSSGASQPEISPFYLVP